MILRWFLKTCFFGKNFEEMEEVEDVVCHRHVAD